MALYVLITHCSGALTAWLQTKTRLFGFLAYGSLVQTVVSQMLARPACCLVERGMSAQFQITAPYPG